MSAGYRERDLKGKDGSDAGRGWENYAALFWEFEAKNGFRPQTLSKMGSRIAREEL